MKLAILSRKRGLYATSRMVDVARRRGHTVRVLDPMRCALYIASGDLRLIYKQRPLHGYQAVIPRIGNAITRYGVAVLRQFEAMGVYTPNPPDGFLVARDKLCTHQILTAAGIPMPATVFADQPDDRRNVAAQLGPSPYVVKLTDGSQGAGVVLADRAKGGDAIVDAFHGLHADFLMQRFIADAKGCDLRCFVIGDRVVAAMMRQAKQGDFRSNLCQGGTATSISVTEEEYTLAVRAASVLGLAIAGVDLIRTLDGPMVLEVNASPGLCGIEQVSGIDIASLILAYVEAHA